jgi:hypothetical protein
MGPRTSLDNVERRNILALPGLELRHLGRPVAIPALAWSAVQEQKDDNIIL